MDRFINVKVLEASPVTDSSVLWKLQLQSSFKSIEKLTSRSGSPHCQAHGVDPEHESQEDRAGRIQKAAGKIPLHGAFPL